MAEELKAELEESFTWWCCSWSLSPQSKQGSPAMVFVLSEFERETLFRAWKDKREKKINVTRPMKVHKAEARSCWRAPAFGAFKEDSTGIIIHRSVKRAPEPG